MDMNEYCLQEMAAERLREMRAAAEIAALRADVARAPLRMIVGHALVRLGNRLLAGLATVRAPA